MRISAALLLVVAAIGCSQYTLESPANFDGESVEVRGRTKSLQIGPYVLKDVQRGWNKGSGLRVMSVSSEKVRQQYEFKVGREAVVLSATACEFRASEKSIDGRGGWSFMLGEKAALSCATDSGHEKWQLELATEGDDVLAGTFSGAHTYRVQGIGLTGLSKGTKGPVAGFHLYDADAPVAVVQTINDKRILFARALDERQRDALMPALAALVLLDESIRDFD